MTDGENEVEPVELLVRLAEEGEIEPWDIDIVEVTEAFLAELDRTDLRTSGRALFYASVLLRMKSDRMVDEGPDDDEEDPEDAPPWEGGIGGLGEGGDPAPGGDPIDAMEAEMERRLDRKQARGTPETLDELIRELRDAERGSWWKESRSYDTSESPKGFRRGSQTLDYRADDDMRLDDEPTADEVTGTAHAEDIEETVAAIREELERQYGAGRREVLFAEVADAGGSTIETFLGLLFLANRSVVRLDQDELFGDLWIQDADGQETPDEAFAD